MDMDKWVMPEWMRIFSENGFLPEVGECEKIMNSDEITIHTTDISSRVELLEDLKENRYII